MGSHTENRSFFSVEYISAFVVIVVTLLFIEDYYKYRFSQKCARKWLPSFPVVGSVYLFYLKSMIDVLTEYSKKFKEPFYFRAFFINHYFTEEPEEIKEILTNPICIEKGTIYAFLTWAIPDSIVLAKDSIWKKKRRYCSKAFSQRRLNRLVQLFDKSGNKLIEKLRSGSDLPLPEIVERNSIESFMECVVGVDVTGEDEFSALYREANVYSSVKLVEESVIKRYFSPWLYLDYIFLRTRTGKHIQGKYKIYQNLLLKIIDERKDKLDALKDEYVDIEEKNLMDIMIDSNADDKDLISDTIIFGTGSTETSGLILSFAFLLLGMHPDIQERVYKEVTDVLGNSEIVEHDKLVDLKYTEMVLNETMRLFPPIPFINRVATADLHLGTKVIWKNTEIIIGILTAQRSSKFWKDPLKFDPERWTPQEIEKRHPFTFLAFSGGPRNCIGMKYGMMMMKTILAKVVRAFKMTSNNKSVEDIKLDSNVTLVVKSGMDCVFTPR